MKISHWPYDTLLVFLGQHPMWEGPHSRGVLILTLAAESEGVSPIKVGPYPRAGSVAKLARDLIQTSAWYGLPITGDFLWAPHSPANGSIRLHAW